MNIERLKALLQKARSHQESSIQSAGNPVTSGKLFAIMAIQSAVCDDNWKPLERLSGLSGCRVSRKIRDKFTFPPKPLGKETKDDI